VDAAEALYLFFFFLYGEHIAHITGPGTYRRAHSSAYEFRWNVPHRCARRSRQGQRERGEFEDRP
jgi:hypothetical protein